MGGDIAHEPDHFRHANPRMGCIQGRSKGKTAEGAVCRSERARNAHRHGPFDRGKRIRAHSDRDGKYHRPATKSEPGTVARPLELCCSVFLSVLSVYSVVFSLDLTTETTEDTERKHSDPPRSSFITCGHRHVRLKCRLCLCSRLPTIQNRYC